MKLLQEEKLAELDVTPIAALTGFGMTFLESLAREFHGGTRCLTLTLTLALTLIDFLWKVHLRDKALKSLSVFCGCLSVGIVWNETMVAIEA